MVPGADERVFPGDVLGVIGTDEEIQKLLPVVEAVCDDAPAVTADDIRLTGVRLEFPECMGIVACGRAARGRLSPARSVDRVCRGGYCLGCRFGQTACRY